MELGVFHVECADAIVIEIEEGEVVHLLQDHVAGIVENVGALVAINGFKEALEGCAVV